MPNDNRTILINRILHTTEIFTPKCLQLKSTIELLDIWLTISRPVHHPRNNNQKIMVAVTA
jgi:hypothetical protein